MISLQITILKSRNSPSMDVDVDLDLNLSRLTCGGLLGLLGHFPRVNTLGSGLILGAESSVVFFVESESSVMLGVFLSTLGFKNVEDTELRGLGGVALLMSF